MLPRANRLPKQDIARVTRYGFRIVGKDMAFLYKKTTMRPRFAFVVSTKVDKRASARNRMRRVLSESIRLELNRIAPCDGVFVIKKPFIRPGAVAFLQQAGLL